MPGPPTPGDSARPAAACLKGVGLLNLHPPPVFGRLLCPMSSLSLAVVSLSHAAILLDAQRCPPVALAAFLGG